MVIYTKDIMKEKAILFKNYLLKGLNQKEAAIASGLNPKNTTYYIKKYKLNVLNKYRKYNPVDLYFDNIDTDKKAYLLGYFIADGYIDNKRICFNSSIDDIEVFNLIKTEISQTSKLTFSNKQTGVAKRKEQVSIRITSEKIIKTL